MVFASQSAEKGWMDLTATQRNAAVDVWDFLTRTPTEQNGNGGSTNRPFEDPRGSGTRWMRTTKAAACPLMIVASTRGCHDCLHPGADSDGREDGNPVLPANTLCQISFQPSDLTLT